MTSSYTIDGTGYVPLRDRSGDVRAWALVDAGDLPRLEPYRWHLFQSYPARALAGTRLPMWKQVLGLPADTRLAIVHKNGNLLDNRRANLSLSEAGALRALEAHPSVSQLLLEREASRLAGAA